MKIRFGSSRSPIAIGSNSVGMKGGVLIEKNHADRRRSSDSAPSSRSIASRADLARPRPRKKADGAGDLVVAPADLIVAAAPMDERARSSAGQHAPHAANDDGVGVAFDSLLDVATEHGDRIGEAMRSA